MFSLKSVGAVALLLTFVAAQTNHTVNIAGLAPDLKASWCSGQYNTCGTLCDGNEQSNLCDPPTLKYTCLCANSSEPGLKYYLPSMPNFLCNALFEVCNAEEVSAAGKSKCLENQKADCGTIPIANYKAAAATTSSASGSSTLTSATATGSGTGAPTAAATTTSSKAFAAPTMVAGLGAGVFAVGVAAFGAML